jgi:hypothetical protein
LDRVVLLAVEVARRVFDFALIPERHFGALAVVDLRDARSVLHGERRLDEVARAHGWRRHVTDRVGSPIGGRDGLARVKVRHGRVIQRRERLGREDFLGRAQLSPRRAVAHLVSEDTDARHPSGHLDPALWRALDAS